MNGQEFSQKQTAIFNKYEITDPRMVSIISCQAWEDNHSDGYEAVLVKTEKYCQFTETILSAFFASIKLR